MLHIDMPPMVNTASRVSTSAFRLQSNCVAANLLSRVTAAVNSSLGRMHARTACEGFGQFPFAILQITNAVLPRPFVLTSRRRAEITMRESEQLMRYARLREVDYLAFLSLLALAQLRTLSLNPVLEAEDILYTCHPCCVFMATDTLSDYARALEGRHVCGGCKDFYVALGAESELLGVLSRSQTL
jgi:hypothetical protein